MPPLYADIVAPLALTGLLTYRLPAHLQAQAKVGVRVVIPIGKRKQYTGIIVRLHRDTPAEAMVMKEVVEQLDASPILLEAQWKFWQWLATYYMCTLGEVMKAALPSGLKLESEMLLLAKDSFTAVDRLTTKERQVWQSLTQPMKVDDLVKATGYASVQSAVRRLLEVGAVESAESLHRKFRPRTASYVRLTAGYASTAALERVVKALHKSPKQESLLLTYLSLAQAEKTVGEGGYVPLQAVSKKQLLAAVGGGESALTALRHKGVLEVYTQEVARTATCGEPVAVRSPLSEAQSTALTAIEACFYERAATSQSSLPICLLHGVTGSGKTEVYMELIARTLERGEQVLYLVPEIALTTQLTSRLSHVFGERMGVYHSKFPDAERVELWQRQLTPQAYPLILGVRSALFLPFQRLGLILIDEEHESSYKQADPAPRYHARDAALFLAKQMGAKALLGTATPSVETYRAALSGRYGLVELTERYGGVALPEVVVEDVKTLRKKNLMRTPFSPRLIEEMHTALEQGEQVILFQNRRGYAPLIQCAACSWTPRCETCDVSLTFHAGIHSLVCHYCGKSYSLPRQCPQCEGSELREQGYGTERIEQTVQQLFPAARTARMDLDTTKSRTAYERILQSFAEGETNVLIGTQMISKGLDFERVRLVGILAADQMMNMPDFRAYERAYQMLSQVAGRAGRRGKRGLVVLQTLQPDLPLVQQIAISDYGGMYSEAFYERKAFAYPPFSRLIYIYFKHREAALVESAAHTYAALLRPHFGQSLLGPDKPVVGRVQSLHIRKLVLKASPTFTPLTVRQSLLAARESVRAEERYRGVTIYFDVDPV